MSKELWVWLCRNCNHITPNNENIKLGYSTACEKCGNRGLDLVEVNYAVQMILERSNHQGE